MEPSPSSDPVRASTARSKGRLSGDSDRLQGGGLHRKFTWVLRSTTSLSELRYDDDGGCRRCCEG